MNTTSSKDKDLLPTELPFKDAIFIYGKRLGTFLLVIVLNIIFYFILLAFNKSLETGFLACITGLLLLISICCFYSLNSIKHYRVAAKKYELAAQKFDELSTYKCNFQELYSELEKQRGILTSLIDKNSNPLSQKTTREAIVKMVDQLKILGAMIKYVETMGGSKDGIMVLQKELIENLHELNEITESNWMFYSRSYIESIKIMNDKIKVIIEQQETFSTESLEAINSHSTKLLEKIKDAKTNLDEAGELFFSSDFS